MGKRVPADTFVKLPDGLYPYQNVRHIKPPKEDKSLRRMDLGVIVILDALGFKGIWARENPTAVLESLKTLRRKGIRLQGKDLGGVLVDDNGLRHRVRCMSDTIVVTVIIRGPQAPWRGLYRAMLSATMIAGSITSNALEQTPPLLFRGCVAAGRMKEDTDFLIGPAVDEAAKMFEKADGPFLWFTRSALEVCRQYEPTFMERIEQTVMVPYRVPLNGGTTVKTRAFTFFCVTREEDSARQTVRRILDAFGEGPLAPNVSRKKDNIAKFLDYVQKIRSSGSWKKRTKAFRPPHWDDLSANQRWNLLLRWSQQKTE